MKKTEKIPSFKTTLLIWAIKLLPNWKWLQQELCRLTLRSRLEARNAFFRAKPEKGAHEIFYRWLSLSNTLGELKDCLFSAQKIFGQEKGTPQPMIVKKILGLESFREPSIVTWKEFVLGQRTETPEFLEARNMRTNWISEENSIRMLTTYIEETAEKLFNRATDREEAQLACEYAVGTEISDTLWIRFRQNWP